MLMELQYFSVLLIFCTHAWYDFGQYVEKIPNEIKFFPFLFFSFLSFS